MRELNRKIWSHKVVIDDQQNAALMEQWLESEVGPITLDWNVVYLYNQTHYYFRNGEQATYFSLRWS